MGTSVANRFLLVAAVVGLSVLLVNTFLTSIASHYPDQAGGRSSKAEADRHDQLQSGKQRHDDGCLPRW